MSNPYRLETEIVFDGRTILLSTVALFFGTLSGVIAGTIAVGYRLYLDGNGTLVGIGVIAGTTVVGILVHRYNRTRNRMMKPWDYYFFGIIVHSIMILVMLLLLVDQVWFVLSKITLNQPVITDVVMPEMSEQEFVKQFTLNRTGTKVLYISGYADKAILRYGHFESNMPFLEKPFTANVLLTKVREILDVPHKNT